MEKFAQNEEMPANIGDPENPLEQIKVLRRIIDKQAKEIIRLKKKVHVSEQRFGVSSGAPAGDTSDLAENLYLMVQQWKRENLSYNSNLRSSALEKVIIISRKSI